MATANYNQIIPAISYRSILNTTADYTDHGNTSVDELKNPIQLDKTDIIKNYFSNIPNDMMAIILKSLMEINTVNLNIIDEEIEIIETPIATKSVYKANLELLSKIKKITPGNTEEEINPKDD